MPIEYQGRPEHNLIILVHVGTIPDDEFLTFYESLYGSNQFDPSMNLLVDLRQADSTSRSSVVLRQLANTVVERYKGITTRPKVAVVAPKDLSFGLARMYEVYADSVPWDFVVFRAVDAALAWLGVPDDLMGDPDPAGGGPEHRQ